MEKTIRPLFHVVNKSAVLTREYQTNKVTDMRYGERLRAARKAKDMTQPALAEASGVSQSLISQLENSLTATGSEYTTRLARTLKISADWLADEIGEMIPRVYQTSDPKIIAVARCMEPMPEYGKDAAVKKSLKLRNSLPRQKLMATAPTARVYVWSNDSDDSKR